MKKKGDFSESKFSYIISGAFLILFASTAFYAWTMEIISSTLSGDVPEIIAEMSIPASVVHVFNMGFALPMIIIGAVLLFRKK